MQIIYNNIPFEITELYQPIYNFNEVQEYKRNSNDRWKTILQAEEGYNNNKMFEGSICDWGCSLGYFSFKLAEKTKKIITAIDYDYNNILLCNEIRKFNQIKNVEFLTGIIPEAIPENYESHIILSTLHHFQKNYKLPNEVYEKIKNSTTIYLELAHCNESPSWANKLLPEDYESLSPIHTLFNYITNQFLTHTVRLIGVHKTHIGSLRPLFQLKKHISEKIETELFTGIIYDRFLLPYIDFGDFSLTPQGKLAHGKREKQGISYAFAKDVLNEKYFLKFINNVLTKKSKFINGFLLSDIIKFGLLPYYDRFKIKTQLTKYNSTNHTDPHTWNFFITEQSEVIPIDFNEYTTITNENLNAFISILIQTI